MVLDWHLGTSYGDDTLEIMRQIIDGDGGIPRLRLFSIYTGAPDLADIFAKVNAMLDEFYRDDSFVKYGPYSVAKGPVGIAIVPKNNSTAQGVTSVPEADLAERLVGEFATMTRGILRNVALEGLAALRDNVPKVVAKFSPILDPGLSRSSNSPFNPAEAEDHIVEALGAELVSILESHRPGHRASTTDINAWLYDELQAGRIDTTYPIAISGINGQLETRLEFIEKGIDNITNQTPGKDKIRESATTMFSENAESANCSNLYFATLLGLKTHYPTTAPKLTLGSIVRKMRESGGWEYFLCLQPKCDAVRLKKDDGFPFLHLSITDDGSRFGCVIKNPEGQWVFLTLIRYQANAGCYFLAQLGCRRRGCCIRDLRSLLFFGHQ